MTRQEEIIGRLKPEGPPREIQITVAQLCLLLPDETLTDIILFLVDLEGVKITNTKEGGIIIPAKYFLTDTNPTENLGH